MSIDLNTLTLKQKKVLSAIETFIKSKGIPPTVREIGEMVGEKTPGAVQGILNRLEQKGVIKREMGMARSIQLVTENSQYINPLYVPEIKKVNKRNVNDLFNIYNIKKYHPISPETFPINDACFMVNCPDNSLLDSGIKYEDVLLLCKNNELKDGDIVLVMYGEHVLLRRYYSHVQDNQVTLKADSDLIGKENFNRDDVTIVGKLVGKYTVY
jgi:repressor LexA